MREAWAHSDYRQRLEQTIAAPRLQRCVTIAVVSPKGGVGKTTTTALLGSLLAFLRRDRVVAVETNPDWGSLGRRLVPDHPVFIDELLAGPLNEPSISTTRLDAQLGRGPDGLMVAPAPTDPDRAAKLDESAYRTLFARLSELVGTLVLDCGTGLDDPPARAALACADQLVLVCDDEPDTASIVAEAASWLRHAGPPLTLVVNNQRRGSRIDLAGARARHRLRARPRRRPQRRERRRATAQQPLHVEARPGRLEDPDPGTRSTARSRLAKARDRPVTTPAITAAQRSTISILQRVRARPPVGHRAASTACEGRKYRPRRTPTTVIAPCRELRCRP